MLTSLNIFNIVMIILIGCFIVAIFRIKKDNKVLREKNQRERARESKRLMFNDEKHIGAH